MEKHWKDLLLKSGLPFEYEVKEKFVENGCVVDDEYIYTKKDENAIQKDFSYDLDATYWKGCSVNFMIECKYKTLDTNWFFLPAPYSYIDGIYADDFFHIGDYFVNDRFAFSKKHILDKDFIGPLCGKGVELFKDTYIETNIRKAINQISYAFVEKIIEGIDEQLYTDTFFDTAFVTIPLIITNAKLNVINERITVQDIKDADEIGDVSRECDFLIHRTKIGNELKRYNEEKLRNYFSANSEYAEKHCREDSMDRLIDRLSEMPKLILIMNHNYAKDNYLTLFNYIDNLISEKHPDAIKRRQPKPKYITDVEDQLKNIIERKNSPTKKE